MPIIGSVEFGSGSKIKFNTRNVYDQNIYSGVVVAVGCKYSVAASFWRDINVYHSQVLKTNPDLNGTAYLEYFLLTTDNEENAPFALDWVDPGSISLISATDSVSLKIHDITEADIPVIRKLLTDNRYRNTII